MSGRGPAIREAGEADREAVHRLFAALQAVELEVEANRLPPEACRPHVENLLRWASFTLLAEAGGEAVGLLIGGVVDEGAYVLPENRMRGEISDLYVAPEARRQGLAMALLAEAERRFVGLGVRRVEIGALAANPGARALYERWAGRPYAVIYAKAVGA